MSSVRSRIEASFNSQALMTTLGAQLAHVADGEVHILLPFDERLTQQHGYLHAGAITSVVDSACGYAALTKAPEGHEIVSVEFKINFLRPALGEQFLCVGKVKSAGRTIAVCTGEVQAINDGQRVVVAVMQATMMNVPRTS
jgi:uncharacterized protein (TIGR00369 family)